MPAVDAKAVVSGMPADQRVVLTIGTTNVDAARASIAGDLIAQRYGQESQYSGSYWFDSADLAADVASGQFRVTCDSVTYTVLGVQRYPGTLRRVDLGGKYAG